LFQRYPEEHLESFIKAGSNWLSIHLEACRDVHSAIEKIKTLGARVGVAINPKTELALLEPVLPWLDFALVMSVEPGKSGQPFIPESVEKIKRLKQKIEQNKLKVEIEVDGGISKDNALKVVQAVAEILVAGAAVFQKTDETAFEAVQNLKKLV